MLPLRERDLKKNGIFPTFRIPPARAVRVSSGSATCIGPASAGAHAWHLRCNSTTSRGPAMYHAGYADPPPILRVSIYGCCGAVHSGVIDYEPSCQVFLGENCEEEDWGVWHGACTIDNAVDFWQIITDMAGCPRGRCEHRVDAPGNGLHRRCGG